GRDALGLALTAAGMLGAGLAPVLALAVPAFALIGLGNGIFYVSNRLMFQRQVPEHLHGRAFGLLVSVDSWAICLSVLMGGALVALLGARGTFTLAATGLLATTLALAATKNRILVPAKA